MESDIITMVLNIPTDEQFYKFLQSTIDEFVQKNNVSHDHINNDVDWSEENQAAARNYFQNIFKNAAMDEDFKISDKLSEMGLEKIKIVEDCFKVRKSEILNKLQTEILAKLDKPLVTGFDWKLKWIIGSSALSSIRQPMAQMDLQTLQIIQNDSITGKVNFEMTTSELDNFITQLENAVSDLSKN